MMTTDASSAHSLPQLVGIGRVCSPFKNLADCPASAWNRSEQSRIEVLPAYRAALRGLCAGSHVFVLWIPAHADRATLQTELADGRILGVFAQRTFHRPNPICLTVASVVAVDLDGLTLRGLECVDGTSVVDIKQAVRVADGHWI
jgi:tRNA-Thr(GGU) m(6)t(6)A37 methyltransferase TsaA